MSSSSGKAWYARLGKAIFGAPDGERSRLADSDGPARERAPSTLSAAQPTRPVRTNSPLPIASPPSDPVAAVPAAEAQQKDAGKQAQATAQLSADPKPAAASSAAINIASPSASTSSSSKRKNLQAILSSSYDDRSRELGSSQSQQPAGLAPPVVKERIYAPTSSHHRTSSDDRGGRKSGDKLFASPHQAQARDAAKGIGVGGQAVPTASPSTLSTSLSQGVKTLTDRYQSSKEASETFNQMRERSDDRRSSISDMLKAERALQGRPSLSTSPSASSLDARQGEGSAPPASAVDVNATANLAVPASPSLGRTTSQSSSLSSTSTVPSKPDARASPVVIPEELVLGEKMLKVTSRKVMQRIVRIDADAGQILWDSKKNNCVNLETIREVRTGSDARSQRASLSIAAAHEDRWISIIYQSSTLYKTLHLIALSEESFERWRSTLLAVQEERKMLASCVDMLEQRQSIWLRQHFKYADASQDARLDFDEVVRLCRRLGIMSSRADLQRRFNEADKESAGYLDFANFQHFVAILKRRVDVEDLFERWAEPYALTQSGQGGDETLTKLISRKQFGAFLHCEQGFASTSSKVFDNAYGKFATVRCPEGLPDPVMMDCNGFLAFLLSSDNSIVADQSALMAEDCPAADEGKKNELDVTPSFSRANAETTEELIAMSGQLRVTQDMTRPISDYYISSSHNTYLVGGQLTGESTAEGYIRALMQGARSVELDCWDGPNNDPVVTHGRTLTSKVPLRDVIRAVERYAFVASPYPLILSLEVHNGLAQQDVIVSILRSILNDKLLSEPLSHMTKENMQSLPSPTDLMGKILVKTKNLLLSKPPDEPERFEAVNSEKSGAASSATTDTTESESDNILSNARELIRAKLSRRKSGRRVEDQAGAGGANSGDKKAAMSASLAALLIYTVGVKHRGINKKETYAVEHMISLSERTANKYAKSAANGPNVDDLIKHNRTHLTRIYPSMHKLARLRDSANFMPNLFWSMGCQLVALNWQTLDLGFEMNQAMFTRNGNCGYVLKPEALRQKSKTDLDTVSLVVEVTIVSAQQLPKLQTAGGSDRQGEDKVMDPYVCVSVNAPELRTFNVSLFKPSPSKPAEEKDDLQKSARRSISSGTEPAPGEKSRFDEQRVNTNSSIGSERSGSSTNNGKNRWFARSRTSTVRQNGFNPHWNETLAFRIRLPGSDTDKEDDGGARVLGDEGSSPQTTKDICQITRGLLDMCFLRFEVRDDVNRSAESSSSRSSSVSSGSISADGRALSSASSQGSKATIASSTKPLGTAGSSGSVAPSDPSRSASDATERPPADVTQSDHDPQDDGSSPCVATYMLSLGAMQLGYHHVPLFDEATLNRHLFSTLFVRTHIRLESTPVS